MSNRRKLQPQNPLSAQIAALDGARILGGCDQCDAYQVIRAAQGHPNVHLVEVYHDGWCPRLIEYSERSNRP
jgi:hypothetical protein